MFKNHLTNNNATICEFTMQASQDSADSKLLKLWPQTNTEAPKDVQSWT